jgi:hypothetical protein
VPTLRYCTSVKFRDNHPSVTLHKTPFPFGSFLALSKDRVHETEVMLHAVETMLQSSVLSRATRLHVEELATRLRSELAELKDNSEIRSRCA